MATTTFDRARSEPSHWLRYGIAGGIVAGIVFAMFEMMMALVLNGSAAFFMPLRMIGGIALGQSALMPGTSLLSAGGTGLVIHMVLSMMFGVILAAVIASVPQLARSWGTIVASASVAGFLLWIVNFYLLANLFGWTWFPDNTNAAVQFVAHTFFFGSVLGLILARASHPSRA